MNLVLWILQVVLALLYVSAGAMKVFTLENVQEQFPTMKALPRAFWIGSGVLEIVCSVGLVVPSAFKVQPRLTPGCATMLAVEALVLAGRHLKWKETQPAVWSGIFAAVAAFVAYGRIALSPIL